MIRLVIKDKTKKTFYRSGKKVLLPVASSSDDTTVYKSPEKDKKGTVKKVIAAAAAVVIAGAGLTAWYLTRDRFHDVTVELGTDTIGISQFMTRYARGSKVAFVTDPGTIDISSVGITAVVLRDGKKEETVTLTVQDTVAPVFTLKEEVEAGLTCMPEASAFVLSCEDEDDVTFSYRKSPSAEADYGDYPVTIVATDASGNSTEADSVLSLVWMKKAFTAEYGKEIKREDLLFDTDPDSYTLSDRDLSSINRADIGTYEIQSEHGGNTMTCVVTKQDTTPPDLILQDVSILPTQTARMRDFIVTAEDARGGVELTMNTELSFGTLGTQEVRITASDREGNTVTGRAKLFIKEDITPPRISGLSAISVPKHTVPDYTGGVSATDNRDGEVEVTVDASAVDVDSFGTYFVTYTATDSDGNTAVSKRRVEIQYDAVDKARMLDDLYAEMPDHDPEAMCEYLKVQFPYVASFQGDDPIWYGLINRKGDCIVLAKLLQAMLNRAGYPNLIVNTTIRHHYWNMLYTDGQWWHLDATKFFPSHLMNDAERIQRIRPGTNWDRSMFPESPGTYSG